MLDERIWGFLTRDEPMSASVIEPTTTLPGNSTGTTDQAEQHYRYVRTDKDVLMLRLSKTDGAWKTDVQPIPVTNPATLSLTPESPEWPHYVLGVLVADQWFRDVNAMELCEL